MAGYQTNRTSDRDLALMARMCQYAHLAILDGTLAPLPPVDPRRVARLFPGPVGRDKRGRKWYAIRRGTKEVAK